MTHTSPSDLQSPDGTQSPSTLQGASDEVRETARLESVTVQKYADSDIVKISEDRYPAILRTDKPYTLSLHPEDIEAFTRLRNNIGLKICLDRSSVGFLLTKSYIPPLSERLIQTLKGHGVHITDGRDDWKIDW